ncbi:MAG: AMP-binding protein [Nitrospirota bacterium]
MKDSMTLGKILEGNSERFPDKTAIIFEDTIITYRDLNETVNKIANFLISLGLKKGDRVGLMLPRIPELVISFLSVAKAHAIVAPINFELRDTKIRTILINISPQCLIVHKQFLELAKRAIPQGMKITIIVVGGNSRDDILWDEIIKNRNSDNPSFDINENDIVYLNYTSGSTGNPKGAITTHSNIYWNTFASVNSLKITEEDVHLCMFAPFAHPHELFARPLYLGGTMVLLDKIYPKSIANAISEHGVTCMMGLASMYETLLELLEHKTYDLGSLRIPESGGMHTRTELIERFRKKIGVPILPVWGSTETTGIAIANIPGETIMLGSVGRPCISYEVKIVDEYGSELPVGQVGEMIFRGPAVIQNYYENSVNNLCFRDGWYYSSDLGRRDDENNFYFVDRKAGMMKVAGLKVYPMEIELVLAEHPEIKEVAVIPANDNLRGEVPKAIIVTKNGKNISEKDILSFCRERMANYKVPRIIEFRDALPKIGSGKINKKELQLEETLNH